MPAVSLLERGLHECNSALEHYRIRRCSVGDHLYGGHLRGVDGLLEEPAGRLDVSPRGHEHVDDLPELVNRPVDVAPVASDLHVGLVHEPASSNMMTAGSRGLGQQRREPLHPPVDSDVVDLDTALGEQLLHVAVRQAEAQVPADRQHDDVGRETEAGEGAVGGGNGARATSSHAGSLAARRPPPRTQQCRHETSG
jgi:hypothetical protein